MRDAGTQDREEWRRAGTAALFVAGAWLFLAVFFDFYYDLNDDTAMRDILSGIYTGTPNGHNIQMLYPLGWCIAMCYRLLPSVPWYGIFLCGCQFLALWLSVSTVLTYVKGREKQSAAALLLTLGGLAVAVYEFVFIQYTVTAGLLVCGALVRLYCGPDAEETGFYRFHLVTALLFVTAFFLRTEMALLLCPFLGLAVLFRVYGKSRRALYLYGSVLLTMAVFMGAGLAADRAAYGSGDWKSFRQFFDDRTRLYDFYGLPEYETNRLFYESIGLSEAQYTLLENYNFDLDEGIHTDSMHQIAEYAAARQEAGPARRLYLSVYTYLYRFTHGQELAFDLLVVFSYFFLLKAGTAGKNRRLLGGLFLLLIVRTGLWLFLLYRGRVPERITHPLYLAELAMLGMFFLREAAVFQWKKYEKSAILSLYVLLFACTALAGGEAAWREYQAREQRNGQWQTFQAYCRERPEQFYYLDVYSTVAYSEKLFSDTSTAYRNFDLLGGWCVKSPAAAEKRKRAGLEDARTALLSGKAYFVSDHTKEERNPDFLTAYYREMGTDILVRQEDTCGSFSIYKIVETD